MSVSVMAVWLPSSGGGDNVSLGDVNIDFFQACHTAQRKKLECAWVSKLKCAWA